jgi:hypothetical protein
LNYSLYHSGQINAGCRCFNTQGLRGRKFRDAVQCPVETKMSYRIRQKRKLRNYTLQTRNVRLLRKFSRKSGFKNNFFARNPYFRLLQEFVGAVIDGFSIYPPFRLFRLQIWSASCVYQVQYSVVLVYYLLG